MTEKRQVSIYTRYIKERPSCYYRVGQYIKKIDDVDFSIHDGYGKFINNINMRSTGSAIQPVVYILTYIILYCRRICSVVTDFIRKPDIIVVQREIMPRYMPIVLGVLWARLLSKSKVIWDFDDYIYLKEISDRERRILEKKSRYIIVISEFLKNLIDNKYRDKVVLLPTTDCILGQKNVDKAVDIREKSYDGEIRLAWVGTAPNLVNLDRIMPQIEEAGLYLKKQCNKDVKLYVVCNRVYEYQSESLGLVNLRWTRKIAKKIMLNSHVGLMPLEDNEYNMGKGGFKIIQYLSAALPVLASSVGYNREILSGGYGYLIDNCTKDGWKDALIKLGSDKENWEEQSRNSYIRYKERFDFEENLRFWKEILHDEV